MLQGKSPRGRRESRRGKEPETVAAWESQWRLEKKSLRAWEKSLASLASDFSRLASDLLHRLFRITGDEIADGVADPRHLAASIRHGSPEESLLDFLLGDRVPHLGLLQPTFDLREKVEALDRVLDRDVLGEVLGCASRKRDLQPTGGIPRGNRP